MKPLLTLYQNPDPYAISRNIFGYDEIHFMQFNYDGKGTALVTHDDDPAFSHWGGEDLELILFGDPYDGVRCYITEKELGDMAREVAPGSDWMAKDGQLLIKSKSLQVTTDDLLDMLSAVERSKDKSSQLFSENQLSPD